ncbi:MAG: hypothetical protein RR346_12380, partial [Bacteroidales bacterium]
YRDDAKKRILFYGKGLVTWSYGGLKLISSSGMPAIPYFIHRNNPYATEACYFLHQKEEPSLLMKTQPSAEGGQVCRVFNDYALHEKDELNLGNT